MTRDIYQYLSSYGLTKEGQTAQRLSKFSESKIERFLEAYLQMAKKRPFEFRRRAGDFNIYPDSYALPLSVEIIRQLAIYSNKIFIHDPLVKTALEFRRLDSLTPEVVIRRSRKDKIADFRLKLAFEIDKMIRLQPLFDAGIIYVVTSELILPQKDPRFIYAEDFYSTEGSILGPAGEHQPQLPENFVAYCAKNLLAMPAKYIDGEAVAMEKEKLSPRNMIAVKFSNDPFLKLFHLFSIEPASSEEDGKLAVNMHFEYEDKGDQNPQLFWHWVDGSKRKSAIERMERLQTDLFLAAKFGAKFITDLPVSNDLASLDLSQNVGSPIDNYVSALLRLELPFFENATLVDIAKARKNEVAFEEFRSALSIAFKEIDSMPGSPEFQTRVDEVSRDLLQVPLAKIEQQMKILRRNLFISATLVFGSLIATIVTQGNNLVTAAALFASNEALKMYKSEKGDEDKVKQLPSFFYWDVTRKSKKASQQHKES